MIDKFAIKRNIELEKKKTLRAILSFYLNEDLTSTFTYQHTQ